MGVLWMWMKVSLFILLALPFCLASVRIAPKQDSVFTSTRYITSITVAPDDVVWASSCGGVLRRGVDGTWTKFTSRDGLPGNEVSTIRLEGNEVVCETPLGTASYQDGKWVKDQKPRTIADEEHVSATTRWKGYSVAASADSLYLSKGKDKSEFSLWSWASGKGSEFFKEMQGSHISALLPWGDALQVAVYNYGLLEFDGKEWRASSIVVPEAAKEITALGGDAKCLWVGTRRGGLWENKGGVWRQYLQPDEPFDHNCQALRMYKGELFISTLEDGLMVRGAEGWNSLGNETLSSTSPRQLVEFQGCLYLRHGNSMVDVYDGEKWSLNVCKGLPRKDVYALAADGKTLYAGQYGGWSEFDGKVWTSHLKDTALQGVSVTTLYSDGDVLWVGTQQRGLGEYNCETGKWAWHDERNDLPDDWVKCIARHNDTLYAGTFVGGLACRKQGKWATVAEIEEGEITAIAQADSGVIFIGTRTGLWWIDRTGKAKLLSEYTEIQALCVTGDGLWIGGRTGLCFVTRGTLEEELGNLSEP